mmetsp:Transcript_24611/g.46663  ORF Transcript_24611/g.46663 Transcript_24611/m.46663 type:complete len:441 (+) Transcript_24611:909-2231(+)
MQLVVGVVCGHQAAENLQVNAPVNHGAVKLKVHGVAHGFQHVREHLQVEGVRAHHCAVDVKQKERADLPHLNHRQARGRVEECVALLLRHLHQGDGARRLRGCDLAGTLLVQALQVREGWAAEVVVAQLLGQVQAGVHSAVVDVKVRLWFAEVDLVELDVQLFQDLQDGHRLASCVLLRGLQDDDVALSVEPPKHRHVLGDGGAAEVVPVLHHDECVLQVEAETLLLQRPLPRGHKRLDEGGAAEAVEAARVQEQHGEVLPGCKHGLNHRGREQLRAPALLALYPRHHLSAEALQLQPAAETVRARVGVVGHLLLLADAGDGVGAELRSFDLHVRKDGLGILVHVAEHSPGGAAHLAEAFQRVEGIEAVPVQAHRGPASLLLRDGAQARQYRLRRADGGALEVNKRQLVSHFRLGHNQLLENVLRDEVWVVHHVAVVSRE